MSQKPVISISCTRDPREHLMEDMGAKLNTEKGTEKKENRN
ncbi:Mobile element protein [Methanosarcina siciliae C2J]|uniref:Mobile element protein n=2 Tax=Methanosarcina siciliae TaxID=38027 RepID=A0A0E3P5Y5_9EURY|nr:Mobile element protein [Methanosarcina siciliae T4/M]AKB36583.1 Mobile element protein [Methanosarcina siciliae C2J]